MMFLTRKEEGEKEEKQFCVFNSEQYQTLAILQQVLIIAVVLAVLKNTW